MELSSDLSFIEIKDSSNPAALFNEWIQEAVSCGVRRLLMNLATATSIGEVSNRTVVIREIMPDGSLAFTAQRNSNKIKDINENPRVAATVLLVYVKNGQNITRQVRFKGLAEKLSPDQCKIYFEKETLQAKIRTWICRECKPVDWNELKKEHDELLKEVIENKKVLELPNTQLAYKIVPHTMEFYYCVGENIADRILFTLDESTKWRYERIMT